MGFTCVRIFLWFYLPILWGEENAVELIQLGVKGYVLKNNIQRLPEILKRAIYGVASQKAIAQQQQNAIDERKARIHHLETQQKTWDEQTKVKQERILHLVHQLAQQQEANRRTADKNLSS